MTSDIWNGRFGGPRSPTNMQLGYLIMRLMLGINLFQHGFMRYLTGVSNWEQPMAETFVGTFLPQPFVHAVLYTIPAVELVLGTLLLLGLFTRWAVLGSVVLFLVLAYGHGVRQNWAGIHLIMHYSVYFWILLVLQKQNWLALDNKRATA